jgi:hypothetical protein
MKVIQAEYHEEFKEDVRQLWRTSFQFLAIPYQASPVSATIRSCNGS